MPAKPIPRQLRASALAFAVRCSARDAPPEPSPQPADEEDDALANGYDAPDDEDASDEADAPAQPVAIEKSPGERFWSRAQSRRRRRRGRDLDAEEAARLAARAPPRPPSPVVEPSPWEQRQEREINAFVRAKHYAQRQREAEIRHSAARARKAPTKRRVAIRLPPAGQREDKLRAAATARQQQEPERRRTVTWDSESDAERMRTLRTKISAVGHVGGRTAAPIPWARVVGDADDGSDEAASDEEHAPGYAPSRIALEFRREETRRRRQKELASIRATETGISCALRSAALRREAVRAARAVDRRRRDHALPTIFAKPREVNHMALSPLGMMLASASAAREQPAARETPPRRRRGRGRCR